MSIILDGTNGITSAGSVNVDELKDKDSTGAPDFPNGISAEYVIVDPGSAASPSITFGGDTNTGLFKPAADTLAVSTNGSERMRITSGGRVGIGTSSPTTELTVRGPDVGQRGQVNVLGNTDTTAARITLGYGSSPGLNRFDLRHTGSIIQFEVAGSSLPLVFLQNGSERMRINSTGNVIISGSLSKGSGSFKIDHPLKPDTHHLVHSFIEGPQADLIYRGKVSLVNGKATVNIDEAGRMTEGTFEALNCNVQCFTNNESGWAAVRGSVSGNILTIEAQDETCTDEISWMVIGERCDQHMIDTDWTDENGRVITEPEKDQL